MTTRFSSVNGKKDLLNGASFPFDILRDLNAIASAVYTGRRITCEEGLLLYEKGELGFLGMLANYIREKRHGHITCFVRNFHIEPTNYCVFDCKFCSYSRLLREQNGAWALSEEEIYDIVKSYDGKPVSEVHIVGGVHPKMGLHFFASVFENIKKIRPDIHIKALTAVELEYLCRKANVEYKEGLSILKSHGLDSIPGGGAEIFDEEVRENICADKCSSTQWLEIHETAHRLGIPSNATMLYGHIEEYRHRIDHMNRVRELQDKTGGFNAFIPLKFRNKDNQMSDLPESTVVEDLKNYAVARIFMDNIPHLKAYWPMISREFAQLSLSFGVDDLDGTIGDTTKIYSLAGAEEQHPAMTTDEIVELICRAGREPVERDALYNQKILIDT